MKPNLSVFFVALLMQPGIVLAAEAMDLSALVQAARTQSESVGLARASLEVAQARRQEALGHWLPQVTLKVGESWVDPSQTSLESPAVRLNARQDLIKGLDQPAALRGGDALIAEAEAGLKQAEKQLQREVGGAYFDVLALEAEVQAENGVLKAAQDALADLRQRVNLGRNRQAELSSAEAQVARIQAILAGMQGRLAEAREALASLTGIPLEQSLAPAADLEAVASLAEAEARAREQASIIMARHAVTQAEALHFAAKGGFLPTLFAEGNWHLARQGGASGGDWDANLGLDLPIFRGGAQRARLRAASAQLDAARLRLSRAEREALREARQAWAADLSAQTRAEATRLALDAVEKSYRDQQRDFRNSLVTNLDLLRVFEAVEAARLEQLRASYDVHRARLRLRLATGHLPVPPERP